MLIFLSLILVFLLVSGWMLVPKIVDRGMHRWVVPYVRSRGRRRDPRTDEEIHVLLCVADHFEPKGGKVTPEKAQARVSHWVQEYPRLFGSFRDSDGRPPRHTFFYPQEEYEPAYLDALAGLCRAGYGEVEIHLHHDRDTAEGLRRKLLEFKNVLANRHGLLARDQNGKPVYGFIHGNWALCNSRSDRRWCGVDNEIEVLRETGCYADFTYPSAPHHTQPPKINSIYYACNQPGRACSHHRGSDAGAARQPAAHPGPLEQLAAGANPGAAEAGLVICQAARTRRSGGNAGDPVGGSDGAFSPRAGQESRGESPFSLPLRDGAGDV
jgi:hypothetical protein